MGKITVTLSEGYPNQFITTTAGDIIKHKEWTDVDDTNREIRQFLQDGSIEVQGSDTMQEKIQLPPQRKESDNAPIVLSAVPNSADSIKEVVTPKSLKENKEVLDKKLKESQETPDEPAPESGDTF